MKKESTTMSATVMMVAARKLRFRLSTEVLRHASSGPTAVRKSNSIAIGMLTLLKNGGPTVILVPWTASDRTGKSVPHSTAKHEASSRTLLNRKLDSRETSDSSLCSERRCPRFLMKNSRQTARMTTRKPTNQFPIDDCAKACTELTRPERVRKVPKIASRKVEKISHMFHIFTMPRFSCIMTECRKAVPVIQGRREAFSTGSHPQ